MWKLSIPFTEICAFEAYQSVRVVTLGLELRADRLALQEPDAKFVDFTVSQSIGQYL